MLCVYLRLTICVFLFRFIADQHQIIFLDSCFDCLGERKDWTDDRKANENPRRGLRVEPGTIMLQAHDATTDCWFKEMKIGKWD